MEIAGWKPDTRVAATDDSGRMQEIPAQEGNCKIRTLVEIKPEFKPAYKMNREYDCINGYARSSQHKRHDRATLYYDGQSQPFTRIDGFWFAGYSLDRGFPKQIASLYNVKQPGGYRNTTGTDKMLVWVGEDRELRTHYFATYTHSGARWALDGTPLIVLTDNEELKNDPGKTSLAQSLAEVYKDFLGYQSTDRFSSVPFVIVDKLHEAPGQSYQQALRDSNPDVSFYKAGNAMRYRGMPWVAEVKTDFTAKREAFALAEQKRIEAEKQRIAQLRARHQAGLDKQYQQLATATRYDQVRFYATLMLASSQMDAGKINFSSNYTYYANPLAAAVNLSHPAQYLNGVSNGKASTGAPLYMIIAADDGEIEKPYPMIVGQNLTAEEIDDWMLVKTGPEFGFGYDDDGKPVFEITIEQAIACKSDKCLNEMDPATMMKSWYNDTDMDFSMATGQ